MLRGDVTVHTCRSIGRKAIVKSGEVQLEMPWSYGELAVAALHVGDFRTGLSLGGLRHHTALPPLSLVVLRSPGN